MSKYKIITEDLGEYKSILGEEPTTGKPVIVLDSSLTPEERKKEIYCLINDIGTNDFVEEELIQFDKYRDSKYDRLAEKICNMNGMNELSSLSNEEVGLLKGAQVGLNG